MMTKHYTRYMSDEQQETEPAGNKDEQHGCVFPTGANGLMCDRPVAKSGKPGRPPAYCDDPEHTRAKAFPARRRFETVATRRSPVETELTVPERPITDGRQSFGALLVRFEESAAAALRAGVEQQAQLTAILERATEVVRTVADPDAAGYEVDQIQREAAVAVAEAQTAQARAEQGARNAQKQAAREIELRSQADEAAAQALEAAAAIRTEAAKQITQLKAETEAAVIEYQRLAEQTRAETADQVTAAQQAAEEARAEATTLVKAAQQELTTAAAARTRAETDQAAAERRAAEDRATAERLRAELDQQRTDHHQELATLRREAAEERASLRKEANEQLATLLARLNPTSETDEHPAAPQPRRTQKSRTIPPTKN
jgi:colicin import membrane protein